jgi:cytoskeletal protein CcmA (bactofilin family)
VCAQRVEIKAAGRVNGTIKSAELVIEAKGIFEGSSIVKDATPAPTPQTLGIKKEEQIA